MPARGGAEVAFGIHYNYNYNTFFIDRICTRRAPARPVRACFVRGCCTDVVQEHDLRTTPAQCNAKRTLSSHFTVHASHPALRTSHLHLALHLTSNHVSSSHLISALLISSHLFSHVIKVSSSQLFSSYPSTDQPLSSPRSSSQLILAVLHAKKLLLSERSPLHKKPLGAESFCTQTNTWDPNAFRQKSLSENFVLQSLHKSTSQYYFALQSLHKKRPSTTLYHKACTKHFPVLLCTTKLAQSTFQYYFVLQSLHKALPSTTLYYKACTKHVPVLLCTAKFAQSTSQYYFVLAQSTSQYFCVLQSLHKALPSSALYRKACTKHFPALLCTTKLAQSTSQYYFVLQSLHKALPSTTLYYKARTKHVPVLLCIAKLARSTSQYYFVLQSLHKALPSTTLYYKARTKHVPVLLCTTKLAQSTSQYYFVLQSSHKARSSTTLYCKACTKSFPIHPNTTLYYKACTKHFPVLLCTTKLAQSTSQLKSTDKSHNLPSRCGFIRFFGRVSSLQTLQVHPISSDFRASSHQLPAFKPQKLSQNAPCLVLASTSDHPRRDPR